MGISKQGGMYNIVIRVLHRLGLVDGFGQSDIPLYLLNVTYPLVQRKFGTFCKGKQSVLLIEEGQPAYIEQAAQSFLCLEGLDTLIHGKDVLPMAGEYNAEVILEGMTRFLNRSDFHRLP